MTQSITKCERCSKALRVKGPASARCAVIDLHCDACDVTRVEYVADLEEAVQVHWWELHRVFGREGAISRALRRYTRCFRCGSPDELARSVPSGTGLGGSDSVSGRLWYCPKCDVMCCIPCAKPVLGRDGCLREIACPRCSSSFQ